MQTHVAILFLTDVWLSLFLFYNKQLTDTFENHFDGADLDFDKEDCENKNRIEKALKDPFRPSKDCK